MYIRQATAADLADLRFCFESLAVEMTTQYPRDYPTLDAADFDNWTLAVFRHLQTNPQFAAFLATDDLGKVIGFIALEVSERLIGRPLVFGLIHWIWVMPPLRASGVGKALLLTVATWLTQRGITVVEGDQRAGDTQWLGRGWTPLATRIFIPVEQLATYAMQPVPSPKDVPSGAVPTEQPPKRKRGRPKKVKAVGPKANGQPHDPRQP